jgi:hypothetical protein
VGDHDTLQIVLLPTDLSADELYYQSAASFNNTPVSVLTQTYRFLEPRDGFPVLFVSADGGDLGLSPVIVTAGRESFRWEQI